MTETGQSLPLFMIRYRHNRELIDVPGRGTSGKDAFERYLARLKSWKRDTTKYKFVSAREVEEPGTRTKG